LFSTFPGGFPGFGLLILRAALGITALFRGALFLSEYDDLLLIKFFGGVLTIIFGALILIGFLTPFASGIVFIVSILLIFASGNNFTIEIYTIVLASAIFFLGPGAFSIDARLFGRREIVISQN